MCAAEMRSRCNTWPLKRFLTEERQQPKVPELPQVQYEDSNHSAHSYNPNALPSLDCWTPDVSQQSAVFGHPSSSQHSNATYPHNAPSTSATNFASLLPSPSNDVWLKEENDEDEQEWNKICRQSHETSRKMNAWGEESYADLITRAIKSAPNSRLKLNEIYQWFCDNIPYFHERSSADLASGWKVRDNLINIQLYILINSIPELHSSQPLAPQSLHACAE